MNGQEFGGNGEAEGPVRPPRRQRGVLAAVVAAALLGPLLLWQVHTVAENLLLERMTQRSTQLLDLYAEGLRGALDRYRLIPRMLALNPAVPDLLASPTDPEKVARANVLFEQVDDVLGSDEIYLMNAKGLTLAASNWARKDSFVGQNFAFRPYFREALQGRLGRYFALGTTSGRRGYYFASPVRGGGRVEGVMVVKVDIESLESGWGRAGHDVMATDEAGVVFMASRPEWVYRAIKPLSAETLIEIAASRRYATRRIEELTGYQVMGRHGGAELIRLPAPTNDSGAAATEALAVSRALADIGWTLRVTSSTAAIRGQALGATIVAAGIVAVAGLLALWLVERRRSLRFRLAQQQREQAILAQAAAELEDRVAERTEALQQANIQLQHEIDERGRAEQELRRTQEDLVQAGKLAGLGQLASGISHELSQPLTAIGTYADNARQLLKRGRDKDASENLSTISNLVSRAAKIIEHLRVFARKTSMEVGPVPVADAVRSSVELLRDVGRLKGIDMRLSIGNEATLVLAEPVRLEQVLINLLQNAADAVRGTAAPRIGLTVEDKGERVAITVADNGEGIPRDDLQHIFDPFFSTKPVGKGMGLGLSISYGIVDAFGGSLKAASGPQGGASFTVMLRRAYPEAESRNEAAHG